MSAVPYERDLAHEADMRELQREQLAADLREQDADDELYDEYVTQRQIW